MYVKSDQVENESKGELSNAPVDAQESANGTATNAFKMRLIIQYRVYLMIHLEFNLKVDF